MLHEKKRKREYELRRNENKSVKLNARRSSANWMKKRQHEQLMLAQRRRNSASTLTRKRWNFVITS